MVREYCVLLFQNFEFLYYKDTAKPVKRKLLNCNIILYIIYHLENNEYRQLLLISDYCPTNRIRNTKSEILNLLYTSEHCAIILHMLFHKCKMSKTR